MSSVMLADSDATTCCAGCEALSHNEITTGPSCSMFSPRLFFSTTYTVASTDEFTATLLLMSISGHYSMTRTVLLASPYGKDVWAMMDLYGTIYSPQLTLFVSAIEDENCSG